MKKLILFAAVAGLGLVSASPPGSKDEGHPREAGAGYPPCSRTVTDSCIQLHEHGMRRRHNLAGHERRGDRHAEHARHGAHHPPVETAARSHYPPCSRSVRDRCNQLHGRGENRQLAMRIRRAGERG